MFQILSDLEPDPILGLIEKFRADHCPEKVDLGVGVYKTEGGETPVLDSVKQAEKALLSEEQSKAYLGPLGAPGFNTAITQLSLGKHAAIDDDRVAVVQTPGGCGALAVAARLIQRASPDSCLWLSDPSWANHEPLLGSAGLSLRQYPYYDFKSHRLDFDKMMAGLAQVKSGDLVLLHACCHNPSGADLNASQWQEVAALANQVGFIPFVDMAYQGFGDDVDADSYGLRLLVEQLPTVIFTVSCSKNFGLYRERTGALGVATQSSLQKRLVQNHIAHIARSLYSMPPAHGAAVVERIWTDVQRREQWLQELTAMRERISFMRASLVTQMSVLGFAEKFAHIERQKGMFSFLGITPDQVQRLANDMSIYMVDSSRINIAGLNAQNIDYFCRAVAAVCD